MRVLVSFLFAVLLGLSAPALAQTGGQVVEMQIPAPALAGNLLNTATVQPGSIYLPPSYAHGQRHYPVIYLLHGYADTRATWFDYIHIKDILDRAIASHRIPEVIVVMSDATNVYGGGFYRNSPVSGRWEDYVADDLIRFTDAHYRTLARAGGRALVGWSMGGYGAIHVAMDHGGLYAAVYAISPCCLAPVEDLGAGNDAWRRTLSMQSPADIQAAAAQHDFYVVAGLAILTSFLPAPDAPPLFIHRPFKLDHGAVVPDPDWYNRYAAEFPVNRVPQAHDALMSLRVFGFDYGIGDQYAHIPPATRLFSERLSEARIPHRFEVYDGDHRNHVAARLEAIVLPYVTSALDPAQ